MLVAPLIPFVTKFYDLQMENETNGGACQLHSPEAESFAAHGLNSPSS
jgi:hypothetical protein